MKEYRLIISHVGKDKDIALKIVAKLKNYTYKPSANDEDIKIIPIYMEDKQYGCVGDYVEWSEKAVESANGVLAIVTDNTAEESVSADGTKANFKIVYDEISFARKLLKDITILRQKDCKLAIGWNLLLSNIKTTDFDTDSLDIKIDEIINDIGIHARARFGGTPMLEYAGQIGVNLVASPIAYSTEYFGRKKEIKQIDDYFAEGKKVVCITGFGGIGKTTLAKMYASAHPETPVSIVYCSSGANDLRDSIIRLEVEYDSPDFATMKVDEKYNTRIKQLKNLNQRTIIIIDNFNADFGTKENKKVLDDISCLSNCNFVISSRQKTTRKDIGLVEVGKLDDKEIAKLFYKDSHLEPTKENNALLKKLIEETHGHTMTIELVAKAIGIDENGVSFEDIVDSFLSNDAVTRLDDREDGYDEYDTIYCHLRKLFDLSQISDSHRLILGALSFVAQNGLTVHELKENIEYEPKDLIYLCSLGYIRKSTTQPTMYSLHPLISELAFIDFAQSTQPFEKIIKYIVYKKSRSTPNDTQNDLDLRLTYAEHLIKRLSAITDLSLDMQRELTVCHDNFGEIAEANWDLDCASDHYKKGLELGQSIAAVADDNLDAMRGLAISYDKLGNIAKAKGDLDSAMEFYKKGFVLSLSIAAVADTLETKRGLSISLVRLGDIAQVNGDIDSATEYYKKSLELGQSIAAVADDNLDSKHDLSICYDNLGDIAKAKGDLDLAAEYYKQSLELRQSIATDADTIESKRSLSISYDNLGSIAQAKGDLDLATEYYKKGLELKQSIVAVADTIQSKCDLSISYSKLGDIAQANGDLDSATEYYKKCLELSLIIAAVADNLDAKRGLAFSYNKLGYIAKAKGDLDSATEYYKKSLELSLSIAAVADNLESKRDLSISYGRLGDIAKAKGDLDSATEYYKKGLELSQSIADITDTLESKRDLAVSYLNLGIVTLLDGDLKTAKKYFEHSLTLAKIIGDDKMEKGIQNILDQIDSVD